MVKDVDTEKWLKKKIRKAQFWQVKTFLDSLRLRYRENNIGRNNYSISAPLFGLRFRFNGVEEPEDKGWKVFFISKKRLETEPNYFREDVMWYLVDKGYMAFIRESEVGGNERIFRAFIIDAGWGLKILEKRLEIFGQKPENTYMRMRTEELVQMPMPKVISYFPGIFDYLV